MKALSFYGERPAGIADTLVPGRLIVIEGTDGVGRSTQIALLKEWLENRGYAVLNTGLTRSQLAGDGIDRAKLGHTLDPLTFNLFYATDFWDQLERQIIPALRAGMVALTDRYVFTPMARAAVRGISNRWMEDLYSFAPVPDKVIYLDIDVEHLIPRALNGSSFDYWESGQDFLRGPNLYENFVEYQTRLLEQFERLAGQYGFATIDARAGIADVFAALRDEVSGVIREMIGD